MALPTQGFGVRALPTVPTIPGNVGVVQPLDPARIAQLASQLRAANQATEIQQRQAALSENAARQSAILARAAESRTAEQFASEAPTRALLAKQAGIQASRVGGEEREETKTTRNPDGTYTITTKKTIAGQPVASTEATTPFATGKPTAADIATSQLTPEEQRQAQLVGKGLVPRAVAAAKPQVRSVMVDGTAHFVVTDPATGTVRPATLADMEQSPQSPSAAPTTLPTPAAQQPFTIQGTSAQQKADIATRAKTEQLRAKARPSLKNVIALEEQAENINRNIDYLEPKVGVGTTGVSGALGRGLTKATGLQTKAGDFAAMLESLQAQQIFNTLTQLRQQSPTGSALGQVTQKELPLLQSAIANIRPDMSDDLIRQNLAFLKQQIAQSVQRVRDAYEEDAQGGYAAYDDAAPQGVTAPAVSLTPERRAQLEKLLAENPNSPAAPQARALLGQ